MSNQIFSFSRFAKFFRFQINLLGRGYLLAYSAGLIISLIVAITLIAVDLSDKYSRPFQEEYQLIVLFGLGVVSVLVGTWMYARLNKKESIIGFLMVPSSHFEKTVTAFILSFIVPAIVCLGLYLICEQAMFAYFRSNALPYEMKEYYSFRENDELRYYGISLWQQLVELPQSKLLLGFLVGIYAAIHGFYVLGSLMFRRFSFVLTSISLGLLIFASVALVIILSHGIVGKDGINQLDKYALYLAKKWFGVTGYRIDDWIMFSFFIGLFLAASAVIWSVTYLKLKEKEVR